MVARLLERDAELETLARVARDAAKGAGSVVLVRGEAGIGKTSLVGALRSHLPADARMLVGYCDALSTPRPLGPFHDLAGGLGDATDGRARGRGPHRRRRRAPRRAEPRAAHRAGDRGPALGRRGDLGRPAAAGAPDRPTVRRASADLSRRRGGSWPPAHPVARRRLPFPPDAPPGHAAVDRAGRPHPAERQHSGPRRGVRPERRQPVLRSRTAGLGRRRPGARDRRRRCARPTPPAADLPPGDGGAACGHPDPGRPPAPRRPPDRSGAGARGRGGTRPADRTTASR